MSLLTDDEIEALAMDDDGSDDLAFARSVEAAILEKLASAELPEPVVQRTKESKEKTLDDWFYASNPAYAKVHSTWKWEGLHTADQLRQAYAQGAASQLAQEPILIIRAQDSDIIPAGTKLYVRKEPK